MLSLSPRTCLRSGSPLPRLIPSRGPARGSSALPRRPADRRGPAWHSSPERRIAALSRAELARQEGREAKQRHSLTTSGLPRLVFFSCLPGAGVWLLRGGLPGKEKNLPASSGEFVLQARRRWALKSRPRFNFVLMVCFQRRQP